MPSFLLREPREAAKMPNGYTISRSGCTSGSRPLLDNAAPPYAPCIFTLLFNDHQLACIHHSPSKFESCPSIIHGQSIRQKANRSGGQPKKRQGCISCPPAQFGEAASSLQWHTC